jgi:tetratricopeptide (TPR) repeat protein
LAVSRSIGRRRGGALVSLASTQRRNGKPSDALDSISEALELDDSPSLALRANTCRVGALRDIGELQRAQALGERLEQLYPDDPKVLRALAAVYRDLFGAGDTRADGLFSLASALEELPQDNFGFADLRNVTPELDALLDRAGRIDDPHSGTFCAFDHWREVFRPELEEIAFSQRADPRLRSERAYALIALLVFRRLPPCRACGRLYSER